jgi:hypothetical protein
MRILLMLSIIFFAACRVVPPKPISKQNPQNNNTYTVEYLFEHDGCKVYRFYVEGHFVYFTSCNGETTSVETKTDSTGTTKTYIKSKNSKN